MTNQHPLTDDKCYELWSGNLYENLWSGNLDKNEKMRAAADWQLEQVLKWIKNCRDYDLFYIKDRALMRRELKKAMRPTTK